MTSSSHLPALPPKKLDAEQGQFYNELTRLTETFFRGSFETKTADGAFIGPFGIMMHTPSIGQHFFALTRALGSLPGLTSHTREVAVLATGGQYEAAYELYAHERVGATVGLTAAEISAIKSGEVPETLDEAGRMACRVARELSMKPGNLDGETWSQAKDILGVAGATALVHYIAFYAYTCVLLNGFACQAPSI